MQSSFWETYGVAFRQTYERAYQEVCERERQKKLAHQQKDLHFLRANLSHFCPEVPAERHEAIYLRLLTNHWLSARSFRYVDFGSLAHMGVDGNTDFLKPSASPRKSHIFCTYHLGGYRAILAMLLNAGYPLTLVIDNRTLRSQEDYIANISAQLNQYNPASASIEMLDAENPAIGRQMAGALHKGRSILIFLDGNTGVGGIYQRNSKQLRVSFLNGTIISRSGIATLAHATRTPIIPIISYYKTVDGAEIPYYNCLPTIEPQTVPTDVFVRETTQKLYNLLADYVRQYVDQWESWFYFHKFLDVDALATTTADEKPVADAPANEVEFNDERYSLFKIDRAGYLFDRQTYQAYPLADEAFDWLYRVEQTGTPNTPLTDADRAYIDLFWKQGALQA